MQDTRLNSEKLYTPNAQAGFRDGLAGEAAQVESEECQGGRFGYLFGYLQGIRKYRESIIEEEISAEERMRRFFSIW